MCLLLTVYRHSRDLMWLWMPSRFEKASPDGKGFERHVRDDHNLWGYLAFLVHMSLKVLACSLLAAISRPPCSIALLAWNHVCQMSRCNCKICAFTSVSLLLSPSRIILDSNRTSSPRFLRCSPSSPLYPFPQAPSILSHSRCIENHAGSVSVQRKTPAMSLLSASGHVL
jgi:hypothetical protein